MIKSLDAGTLESDAQLSQKTLVDVLDLGASRRSDD